jgi:RloB-like protein
LAAVDLRIEEHQGSEPLTLVRAAITARNRAFAEEGEVDEFWCVFDVEWPINHPNLHDALLLAREHGIEVAISNPCFEIWLVLHFQDHAAWLDNDDARRLRRGCDGKADKSLNGPVYMPRRGEAVRRARLLDERHARDGTRFPDNNPSSGMHRLLASVEPPTR